MKRQLKNLLNQLLIPFAILHIRYIQWRYKRITTRYATEQNSPRTATLILLQAKEFYYEKQFSAWGKYHPGFTFSKQSHLRHLRFMRWLFPKKDFQEWSLVVWQNPRAVAYYHSLIYKLDGRHRYEAEIPDFLEKMKRTEDYEYRAYRKRQRNGYYARLKEHPGVPVAAFMTVLLFIGALGNENLDMIGVCIVAGIASALVWLFVLLSNIKRTR